ncbi:hypothetical protein [Eubacterium ramulus]
MIKKFWEYGKFKEYFVWAFENRFALIGTVLLVIATYYLKIYEDLQNYISILDSTFGVIIGALIGTLALIFSGIVFWGSLFDKKFRKKIIEYTEDEKTVDKLYISYLFLACNILGNIVFTVLLILALNSSREKVGQIFFVIIEIVYVYWLLFILGYFVAIMKNGIKLIWLRDGAEENEKDKKSLYESANELRIDVLFELLCRNMTAEETHDTLMNILNNRIKLLDKPEEEKRKLAKYLENYYKLEKNEKK